MHDIPLQSPSIYVMVTDRMVKVYEPYTATLCVSGGGGGVNEIESTVKGAKAGEAQSWLCAGNELVLGEGDSLPGSVCLSE